MYYLMYKSAIGVKGYGDGGIVLGVGNVEPRTEDHAPVSCCLCPRTTRSSSPPERSWVVVKEEDDVIRSLLQLLPLLLTVAQSIDELLIWILVVCAF